MIMSERKVPVYAPHAEREIGPGEAPQVVRSIEKTDVVRRVSVRAWVALLTVWVVWGSTYLAIRVGDETIPPLVLAAVRFVIAGVIMFPVAFRNAASAARAAGQVRYRPRRSEWLGCAVVGI